MRPAAQADGIAVELGAAGATVYCTGRSTGSERSEMNRPETIDETAALVDRAGGRGIAVRVDHLRPAEVASLVQRIEAEQGALHILVNSIWGATKMEWNKSVWQSDLDFGLHTLRLAVDTHAITSHFAIPLMIKTPGGLVVEVTDGTAEYNSANYRVSFFYDLSKAANLRIAFALAHELKPHRATAVALTPGWLRSEMMLDAYGIGESNWRDATMVHLILSSRKARRWSAARSRHWRKILTSHAGMANRSRAGNWQKFTASPISMVRSPMPGAICVRCKTPVSRPMRPGTDERVGTIPSSV